MKKEWEVRKLSDISSIMYGYTAKAKSEHAKAKYLRITDIQNSSVDWGKVPFCDLDGNKYSKYQLKYGDIVFARTGATTGKSFLVLNPPNAVFASYLIRVQTNPKQIMPEFLYQYFQTPFYWNVINKGISGSAQGGFNATKLGELKIPFPPLPEQERIVAKLNHCFEAIDQANSTVERNLQNANELFQSQLNQIFTKKGGDWVEKKLGEVYDVRDGTHDSPKYQEEGFPLVTSKNLKNNSITFEKIKYISEYDYVNINKRSKVDKGDVLFAMIGTIGNPIVITKEPNFAIKNVALFKVPKEHSSQFLNYYLKLKIVVDRMEKEAKGSTQRFVGLGYLRSFSISIPPLIVQQKLVRKLNVLNNQTQSLETHYKKELDALDELKKSILQKAFNGELATIPKEATA